MGVKGRRVSIIEELSGCIISFQKVAQEARERTLTITGPNDESILHAKILIEDTIRRNVSPTRPGDPQPTAHHQPLIGTMSNDETKTSTTTPSTNGDVSGDELECALNEMGSILKLSCNDANVLKVARQALNEYFQRRDANNLNRRLSTGDVLRRHPPAYGARERRKSMPLPLNILEEGVENQADPINPTTPKLLGENSNFEAENSTINQSKFGNALSTPSLFSFDKRPVLKSTSSVNEDPTDGRTRIVYTRDYLLQCSSDVPLEIKPELSSEIREKMDEVVLENPRQFDGQSHKQKFAVLKQYAHIRV
uniref:K Homology domain-containing protein n=1 Tax=Romanomermis culicivorax TaxID=13658 RepID=A0A915JGF7_ROMCU